MILNYRRLVTSLIILTPLLCIPKKSHGRFYNIDVNRLQPSLGVLDESSLQSYLDQFFQINPSAYKHLVAATTQTMKTWCKSLAKAIAQRYRLRASSTADNRTVYYTNRLMALMQNMQASQQEKALQKGLDLIESKEPTPLSLPSLSLHMVLDSYESQELATELRLKEWKQQLDNPEGLSRSTKEEMRRALVAAVNAIKENYEIILESLVGMPDAVKRQDLKEEWSVLLNAELDDNGLILRRMLNYATRIAAVNRGVIKTIGELMAQTRIMANDSAQDETLGQMVDRARALIIDIENLKNQPSYASQQVLIRDLCLWAALELWNEWCDAAQLSIVDQRINESHQTANEILKGVKAIEYALTQSSASTQSVSLQDLMTWFSPLIPGHLASVDLMKLWVAQLMELRDLVKNVVRSQSYVRIFSQRLPVLTKRAMDKLRDRLNKVRHVSQSDSPKKEEPGASTDSADNTSSQPS